MDYLKQNILNKISVSNTNQKKKKIITIDIVKSMDKMTREFEAAERIARFLEIGLSTVHKWQQILQNNKSDFKETEKLFKKLGTKLQRTNIVITKINEIIHDDNLLTQNEIVE